MSRRYTSPRRLLVALVCAVSTYACESLLPDPPLRPPTGAVEGLGPVYFDEAPLAGEGVAWLGAPQRACPGFAFAYDTLTRVALCVDRLEGLHVQTLTTQGDLLTVGFLAIPGVVGVTVGEADSNRLTARTLFGERDLYFPLSLDTVAELAWRPVADQAGAAQPTPPFELLWELDEQGATLEPPYELRPTAYFACPDPTRGPVAGWRVERLVAPRCLTEW